jgi:hypothetical protein
MWMGGNPPLGYDIRDRKLVVNVVEAGTVRHIFRRYVALRSVRLLAEDLADGGITSKQWLSTSGRQWGGQRLARGALYLMLQNRIYLGEIVHKDRRYPGQHAPIVDQTLWDQVQEYLATNAVDRRSGRPAKQPSLLVGLIFDSLGHRMSPTHAVKGGKRYRYYISRPLVTEGRGKAAAAYRIPAPEVEQVVTDRVRTLLADGTAVFDALSSTATTEQSGELLAQAAELARSWPELASHEQRRIISTLIARVEVGDESVALHVVPTRLGAILRGTARTIVTRTAKDAGQNPLSSPSPFSCNASGRAAGSSWAQVHMAPPVRMPRCSGCWHVPIRFSNSCCMSASGTRRGWCSRPIPTEPTQRCCYACPGSLRTSPTPSCEAASQRP